MKNLELIAAILTLGILQKGSSTCECIESFYMTLDLLKGRERERRVKVSAARESRQ
jgi:hypothetical protein